MQHIKEYPEVTLIFTSQNFHISHRIYVTLGNEMIIVYLHLVIDAGVSLAHKSVWRMMAAEGTISSRSNDLHGHTNERFAVRLMGLLKLDEMWSVWKHSARSILWVKILQKVL